MSTHTSSQAKFRPKRKSPTRTHTKGGMATSQSDPSQDQTRNLKRVKELLQKIAFSWDAPPNRKQLNSPFSHLNTLLLHFFKLGQALEKLGGYSSLAEVVELEETLVQQSIIPLSTHVHDLEAALEIYCSRDLAGIEPDVTRVCQLRSGIQFFFDLYSGYEEIQLKAGTLGNYMESYQEVFERVKSKFESWKMSHMCETFLQVAPHMPRSHAWWPAFQNEPLWLDEKSSEVMAAQCGYVLKYQTEAQSRWQVLV